MAKTISTAEITGESVIDDVPVLDPTIPLTDDTKMYLDIEKTFRQIPLSRLFNWFKGKMTQIIYPVGSVYMTFDETDPSTLFGGTWEKVEDRFLLGSGNEGIGTTGGNSTHTLTTNEMPNHSHNISITESGSHTHNITIDEAGDHSHTPANSIFFFSVNKDIDDGGTDGGIMARRRVATATNGVWAITSKGQDTDLWQYKNTSTDGSHNHAVNISSNGTHNHNISITSTGSGQSFDIIPPYTVVNIWKRVS